MASFGVKGGDNSAKVFAELGKKLGKGNLLKVGFFETETYPDGMHVAQAAFWAEYGTKSAPPRPFFRNMIATRSKEWGAVLAAALKITGNDILFACVVPGNCHAAWHALTKQGWEDYRRDGWRSCRPREGGSNQLRRINKTPRGQWSDAEQYQLRG